MKRLLLFLLCLALFALSACGQEPPAETTAATTTQTTPVTTITQTTTTTEATTTTQAATTQPIKYPKAYKDAPKAYKPVLDDLYALNLLYDFDTGFVGVTGFPYAEAIIGAWFYGPIAHYAVADINHDTIPELLLYQETADDMYLRSLFTIKDGAPFCVESFPGRLRRFAADGTMYYVHSVEHVIELYSDKLDAGATEFTLGTAYYNYNGRCSKILDMTNWQNEEAITEEEFNAMLEIHRNPPNPMKLKFIPIEQ